MEKRILLTIILFLLLNSSSIAQDQTRQISINGGVGIALLQDELWGDQIYRGLSTDLSLDYFWSKSNRSNSIYLNAGRGDIAVPNSIRRGTDAYQFYLRYQHLRKVKTFHRSKIDWSVGGGVASFVQFRNHNSYSGNNLASFDLGASLQLQNYFYKILVPNKIEFSFLVETALLSSHLKPSYSWSNTEEPLNVTGLQDVTLEDITSRMRLVSFPSLLRLNMYTTMYLYLSPKTGVRFDYNWQALRSKSERRTTYASHHLQFGLFFRLGNSKEI